ncbi:UNKNOWN [Stylonychia lemnae]|uniref:Uncharacterized protein n=1 Tax=Stylonychia lemnae TaxID=5949 RepID=A0A078B8J9_STYLE|nr:UNKNOWN [Stylonychia lemnae]|eukprot:CDW89622.1 UNKNOWN [Stylonychia lemnae]
MVKAATDDHPKSIQINTYINQDPQDINQSQEIIKNLENQQKSVTQLEEILNLEEMEIDFISDGEIKSYLLFETYEDQSSQQNLTKIKLNKVGLTQMINNIHNSQCQVIGYYGHYQSCIKAAQIYLQGRLSSQVDEVDEGILAFQKENKIALVYKTIYDYHHEQSESQFSITYLRYIIDMCQKIICLPSPTLSINPDLRNPFLLKTNPSLTMREIEQKPHEAASINLINCLNTCTQLSDIQIHLTSCDNQNYISSVKLNQEFDWSNQKMFFDAKLIRNDLFESNFQQYTFDQLKREVILYWQYRFDVFHSSDSPNIKIGKIQQKVIKLLNQAPLGDFLKRQLEVKKLESKFQKNVYAIKIVGIRSQSKILLESLFRKREKLIF